MTRVGLTDLEAVELTEERARFLAEQEAACRGTRPWRLRKLAELRTLLRLDQIVPRLSLVHADVRTGWHALVALECPVPVRAEDADDLEVAPRCALALGWPERALREPLPGHAFVGVLDPRPVWHPHVSFDEHQRLCLGAQLPRCTPLLHILVTAYGALTLQNVHVDPRHPAGVMNADAARWYLERPERGALTREAFLPREDPVAAPSGGRP